MPPMKGHIQADDDSGKLTAQFPAPKRSGPFTAFSRKKFPRRRIFADVCGMWKVAALSRHSPTSLNPLYYTSPCPLVSQINASTTRIHQVTSPPPPHPPSSIKNVMSDLRSGKGAVLPGGGVGFQAVLCGKRGRRALRASEALTEEV